MLSLAVLHSIVVEQNKADGRSLDDRQKTRGTM